MPIFNVSEAKTRFSRLLAQVPQGEEVNIACRRVSVAIPFRHPPERGRQLGAMKWKIKTTNVFLKPTPEQELKLREGR